MRPLRSGGGWGDSCRVRRFVDDDGGYLSWLAAHPAGYVVNAPRDGVGAVDTAPRGVPHDQWYAVARRAVDRAVHQVVRRA